MLHIYCTLPFLDRGRVRTRSWLHNATVEERAVIYDSNSPIKDRLEEDSPFHKLVLPTSTLKHLLNEEALEKAINIACSGVHVRCLLILLLHLFLLLRLPLLLLLLLLHILLLLLVNPALPSSDFTVEDGALVTLVKSEQNLDPGFGPTEYTVRVKYTPGVNRRGRGRGEARKNKPDVQFELKCNCLSFNGMCKHVAAVAIVHF